MAFQLMTPHLASAAHSGLADGGGNTNIVGGGFIMGDRLSMNAELGMNDEIVSNSGNCRVIFQGDGNLVLYRLIPPDQGGSWQPVWDSATYNTGATHCVMQGDGNLVIYDASSSPKWDSKTFGKGATFAVIQDDENFVLYRDDGTPVWASNTFNPHPYAPPPCAEMKQHRAHEKAHLEQLMAHPDPTNPAWKASVTHANLMIRGWTSLISIKC